MFVNVDLPSHQLQSRARRSDLYHGWKIAFLAFLIATFGWGLGFYGPSVYLAALVEKHGWAIGDVSALITLYYVAGAGIIFMVGDAIERFGPRLVVGVTAASMGTGVLALLLAREVWQLAPGFLLMSIGWCGMSMAAVNAILAPWFDRKRGLAVSLALNGASTGGIVVGPLLIAMIQLWGLATALMAAVATMALLLSPLILLWLHRGPATLGLHPDGASAPPARSAAPAPALSRAEILRHRHFWTTTVPFAAGLVAQVGFIIHMLAYLQPLMGPAMAGICISAASIAAVVGRLVAGLFIDRLRPRFAAAGCLVMQVAALATMVASSDPVAVFGACIVFGLGVGNLITFPSLIVQREFAARDFARVISLLTAINQVTYAFGPGLLGWLRDLNGSYALPHLVAAGLMSFAACVVLIGPRRS